jgi:hypothetical protein
VPQILKNVKWFGIGQCGETGRILRSMLENTEIALNRSQVEI